eukprot:1596943-Rhodomonas_salina.1
MHVPAVQAVQTRHEEENINPNLNQADTADAKYVCCSANCPFDMVWVQMWKAEQDILHAVCSCSCPAPMLLCACRCLHAL